MQKNKKIDELDRGVVIACDKSQEWILPFWKYHYGMHNNYPVFAVDFGMSEKGSAFCKKHFIYHKLEVSDYPKVAKKEEVDPSIRKKWEKLHYPNCWNDRMQWFKKPSALAKSPFNKSIWVDLDTEVLGPLAPIFESCNSGLGLIQETDTILAFVKQNGLIPRNQSFFSSALIVFEKGNKVITKFLEQAPIRNHLFFGDQELLCDIIHQLKYEVTTLPNKYLKEIGESGEDTALIKHFAGSNGKNHLRDRIETYQALPFLQEQFVL